MEVLYSNFEEQAQLNRIFIEEIFNKADVSEENKEIFVLRYGYGWYYHEIGSYVGKKYRGKPYVEGTVRYRLKKVENILRDFLSI